MTTMHARAVNVLNGTFATITTNLQTMQSRASSRSGRVRMPLEERTADVRAQILRNWIAKWAPALVQASVYEVFEFAIQAAALDIVLWQRPQVAELVDSARLLCLADNLNLDELRTLRPRVDEELGTWQDEWALREFTPEDRRRVGGRE